MPTDHCTLQIPALREHLATTLFGQDSPHYPGRVGLEIELFPFTLDRAHAALRPLPLAQPDATGRALLPFLDRFAERTGLIARQPPKAGAAWYRGQGGGTLTFEPGGQIEYSGPPQPTAAAALADAQRLLTRLTEAASAENLALLSAGLQPWHPLGALDLQVAAPRYRAMHSYFAALGPYGRRMMRQTGALQVNLDLGDAAQRATRWRLANQMAPVLTAICANSPLSEGRPTGYRSTRAFIWQRLDRSRTGYAHRPCGPADPVAEYLAFALDARVMLIRCHDDQYAPGDGLTFRAWLEEGHPLGYPDWDDWTYHLTTLFPEVRARGFLELRGCDALPAPWSAVPVLLTTALLYDPEARARALALLRPHVADLGFLWGCAARQAVADPCLSALSRSLFTLALEASMRFPDGYYSPAMRRASEAFFERYTARNRCLADDQLDAYARTEQRGIPGAPRAEVQLAPPDSVLSPGHPRGPSALKEALTETRERTEWLLAPVADEDLHAQHDPIMSPLVWDYGHIGNFEELWLVRALQGLPSPNPERDDMYDAFRHPRRDRPRLPLLQRDACRAYLAEVRAQALDLLDRLELDSADPLRRDGFVYHMILQHEYQHNETMLATLQLMRGAGYCPQEQRPLPSGGSTGPEMVFVTAGPFLMGTDDRVWAYDNERPLHVVDLPAFEIDTTPVSNAAYLRFIADGGYRRRELWSEAGWAWLQESGATAPKHWHKGPGGSWWTERFAFREPVNPNAPVVHVCWYEAEAYARWAGKRLPTEAEWEKAASWDPTTGRKRRYPWGDEPPTPAHANLDQTAFGPAELGAYPRGVSPYGCQQLIGDVWEWTASDFHGYPGYASFPYKEYSGVFFGPEYKVLRGGSWATRPGAIRNTFRNWDYPIRRQIFSGFRCARDV